MNEILELLTYPFVFRALISGSLISVCASILGVILVLKHYSLIGHGLSEIGFASLSISSALNIPPIVISTPSVILASFVIMFTNAGDVAIAVASSAALSLGIVISSLTGSISNTSSYLFGSVLAVSEGDLIFSIILSFVIIISFVIFYNRLFLITYNEDYARSLGINTKFYQVLISILTALTVVSGMRIMGTLLISGVIILPAVSARNLSSGFKTLIIISGIISFAAFLTGLIISFVFNIPTGAGIILTNIIILIMTRIKK